MAPMTRYRYEYVRMNLDDFPEEIIEEYKLRDIASKDGGVIAECRRCIYGLPQAGILANKYLEKRLNDSMDIIRVTTPMDCGATNQG
jgi:hypothetical protein